MSTPPPGQPRLVYLATFAALAMIMAQVGAKATRDALFLTNFPVTDLPKMVIFAALFSVGVAFLTSGTLTRYGPLRVIPGAFAASGLLALGEFLLYGPNPRVATVVAYLHLAGFGAALISGYWSLMNERFDPRSAKQSMSRIAAGATIGGLLGGILAERIGAIAQPALMLPVLGLLQFTTAAGTYWLSRGVPRAPVREFEGGAIRAPLEGLRTVKSIPYLRTLAGLVCLGAISAALLDYLLKSQASVSLTDGPTLLRFFGLYYTGISVVTVLIQTGVSRRVLEKLGLARTAAVLPGTMVLGGIANWLAPGLGSAIAGRGGTTVVQNSIFRSAYEVLFTPIVPERKRSTKAIIDVGFERLGDATGAGIVQALLATVPGLVSAFLAWGAIVLGLGGLYAARRLHTGYVRTLEENLESHAAQLGDSVLVGSSPKETVMQSLTSVSLSEEIRKALEQAPPPSESAAGAMDRVHVVRSRSAETGSAELREKFPTRRRDPLDPLLDDIAALRSRDPKRVVPLLSRPTPLPTELAGHLIPLLAWDELSERVVQTLRRMAPRIVGQLGDSLVQGDSEFAVRRRLPRVLEACDDPRCVESLLRGLEDRRFEVRYQCGRALFRIQDRNPEIEIPVQRVFALVENEVDVDRSVWEGHRILDSLPPGEKAPFEDRFLERRATRSLEHVFTVLSLALPTDPLLISYRGLHTTDPQLRGTALEYLENVLPLHVRRKLWPFLEVDTQTPSHSRTREEILRQLMESNESIELNLKELREEHRRRGEETS